MSSLEAPSIDFDTDFQTDFDDYTDYATEAPLPTPGSTPYTRTPAMSRSQSRGPSPSPSGYRHNSSSPPPIPHGRGTSPRRQPSMTHMRGRDGALDENISILDPRRFTPTLHANLVAEILSLRRELESKSNLIDTLEQDLAAARTERETSQTSAATALKEARDAKRQLAKAEHDDSVTEVARERDEAVESLVELKKQVERLTVSRRKAEEDLQRMKKIHERDAEKAEEVRRALERRAHVAEGRLKAVLDEIAAANERPPTRATTHSRTQSKDFSLAEDSGSDTASIMTFSVRNRPMSLDMGDDEAEKLGIALNGALSLADELQFGAGSGSDTAGDETAGEDNNDDGAETDLEPEHDNPDEEAPGMVSDVDSAHDVDELPEIEHVEIGIQVIPEIDDVDSQRIVTLEGFLEEKSEELRKVYSTLDEKSAELEAAYEALDTANNKITELEDEMENMEEKAAQAFETFKKREADFATKMESFEARQVEFEDKVITLDQRSSLLNEKENRLQEEENKLKNDTGNLGEREKKLDERERKADDRDKKLDDREKKLDNREKNILDRTPAVTVPKEMKSVAERLSMFESKPKDTDEATIRRKRASGIASPPPGRASSPKPTEPVYVSAEMQTQPVDPPSPPVTPTPPEEPEVEMVTSSTQTDPVKATPPPVIHVPGIFISPPEPTPPLPKPPMKDAITQTKMVVYRTTSMQTQEIRLDERLKKFAPHLIPENYQPKTIDAECKVEEPRNEEEPPAPILPRRSSKRITVRRSLTMSNAPLSAVIHMPIPTYNDADVGSPDPGEPSSPESVRKPKGGTRYHFNGRDSALTLHSNNSSGDEDMEDEYHTALSALKPRGLRSAKTPISVPTLAKPFEPFKKPSNIRKNALVASGTNVHARSRVVSDGSNQTNDSAVKVGPPFPVPTRHSSRRPGYISDRMSNASPTPKVPRGHRNRHGSTSTTRSTVRKSRSAAQLSANGDPFAGYRSPSSTVAPDSPPPLPKDIVPSPAFSRFGRHKTNDSNMTSTTGKSSVGGTTQQQQQTSVVDAIAQTMIGEWMWKYVRRRRSFGVSDTSPQVDDAGGQRHKRWVWLAPYERAVMWSNRQPTSGSALLGKSGRKRKRSILHPSPGGGLVDSLRETFSGSVFDQRMALLTPKVHKVLIQSVLDVKDETPLPKGASLGPPGQPPFNRSIIILTPARALKFTASSLERHYVWLTALSFLAHSGGDNPDGLLSLPPPMPFEYEQMEKQTRRLKTQNERRTAVSPFPPPPPPPPPANLNKRPSGLMHRDSVRVTKHRSSRLANHSPVPPLPAIPPSIPRQPHQSHQHQPSIANTIQSEDSISAALPPSIPRFPGHSRRRSNSAINLPRPRTGDRPQPKSSFEEFQPYRPGVIAGIGIPHHHQSRAPSPLGSALGPTSGMGTVRMEAFISVAHRASYEFDEFDELEFDRRSVSTNTNTNSYRDDLDGGALTETATLESNAFSGISGLSDISGLSAYRTRSGTDSFWGSEAGGMGRVRSEKDEWKNVFKGF